MYFAAFSLIKFHLWMFTVQFSFFILFIEQLRNGDEALRVFSFYISLKHFVKCY